MQHQLMEVSVRVFDGVPEILCGPKHLAEPLCHHIGSRPPNALRHTTYYMAECEEWGSLKLALVSFDFETVVYVMTVETYKAIEDEMTLALH